MVKGITRQVVVVKRPDQKLFDQAIFLVREDALADGGITEEALLSEARMVCRHKEPRLIWFHRLLWAFSGAAVTGLLWFISAL